MGLNNLLTAIEQANKLSQLFGLQFFAYVSDGEQKENLSSNLVLSDLETVVGGLREWRTGEIPEPDGPAVLILERRKGNVRVLRPTSNYTQWELTDTRSATKIVSGDKYTGRWFIQPITLPKK